MGGFLPRAVLQNKILDITKAQDAISNMWNQYTVHKRRGERICSFNVIFAKGCAGRLHAKFQDHHMIWVWLWGGAFQKIQLAVDSGLTRMWLCSFSLLLHVFVRTTVKQWTLNKSVHGNQGEVRSSMRCECGFGKLVIYPPKTPNSCSNRT